jgi:hypothetical protein
MLEEDVRRKEYLYRKAHQIGLTEDEIKELYSILGVKFDVQHLYTSSIY